jgi:hypothetical protein
MEPDFETTKVRQISERTVAVEYRLSGSSTALGMARTFKALRQRSAFFFAGRLCGKFCLFCEAQARETTMSSSLDSMCGAVLS